MTTTIRKRRSVLARKRIRRIHEVLRFVPSPPFEALERDTARKVLLRAANRVGKTRHCARLAAKRAINNPGHRIRVIGPTNRQTHTVLGAYLFEFLEPYLAPGLYYVEGEGINGGRKKSLRLRNGSVVELRSLEDDINAHAGSSQHLIVFDEPPKQNFYMENAARLVDTGGQMIIAATMVNRNVKWLRTMVEGDEDSPTEEGRHVMGTGWVQYVAKFSRVNCPWYTVRQIEDWIETCRASAWQWAQRIEAAWDGGVSVGRRFVSFDEDNVISGPPDGDWRVGVSMDHGEVAGHQIALLFYFTDVRIVFIDEYSPSHATNPDEDARAILSMLKRNGLRLSQVDLFVGDVNSAGKYFANRKVNEELERAFATQLGQSRKPIRIVIPDKTPGSVDWGQRCINAASSRGWLHVSGRCVHLLETMRHWKGSRKGTEDALLSHAADAARYAITSALGKHKTYRRLFLVY